MFGRHHFVALACAACGTHRLLPKALSDQSAAETLYNQYAGAEPSDAGQPQFIGKMLKRLAETQITVGQGKNILDVGCGSGVLLEAICARFDCAGLGIDVDRRRIAKAAATAKHARFTCGFFDPAKLTRKYDLILATAIVEHVLDPATFLAQLHQALADGGSLFLLTPNARSLNYRLLRSWWRELLSVGEHIYLFTPESLARCAGQAGFQLVRASSDFDWSSPRLRLDSPRNFAISLWAGYCEFVKRVSGCLASAQAGDILSAHFRKPSI
jgi:2-polyprenyl-3-methyl-5-hydroxy-6-metoxy-1,4-benzoquinol methylase